MDGVAAPSTGDDQSLAEPTAGSVPGQSDALTRAAGASASGVGRAAEPQCGQGSEPTGAHPAMWDSSGPGPDGRARQLAKLGTAGPDHTGEAARWLRRVCHSGRAGTLAFPRARTGDRMLPWPLSLLVSQMRKENEMMRKAGNIVAGSFACLSLTACLLMLVAHLVGCYLSQLHGKSHKFFGCFHYRCSMHNFISNSYYFLYIFDILL